jgi:hypothetical protein
MSRPGACEGGEEQWARVGQGRYEGVLALRVACVRAFALPVRALAEVTAPVRLTRIRVQQGFARAFAAA